MTTGGRGGVVEVEVAVVAVAELVTTLPGADVRLVATGVVRCPAEVGAGVEAGVADEVCAGVAAGVPAAPPWAPPATVADGEAVGRLPRPLTPLTCSPTRPTAHQAMTAISAAQVAQSATCPERRSQAITITTRLSAVNSCRQVKQMTMT